MIAKWIIVGMLGLSALMVVAAVGKQRRPITPGAAATAVVVNAAYIIAIVIWWRA